MKNIRKAIANVKLLHIKGRVHLMGKFPLLKQFEYHHRTPWNGIMERSFQNFVLLNPYTESFRLASPQTFLLGNYIFLSYKNDLDKRYYIFFD